MTKGKISDWKWRVSCESDKPTLYQRATCPQWWGVEGSGGAKRGVVGRGGAKMGVVGRRGEWWGVLV